jgi:hypothetical protein
MSKTTTPAKKSRRSSRKGARVLPAAELELRDPVEALLKLEDTIQRTYAHVVDPKDDDDFVKYANSLGMNVMRLVNSHRILRFLEMNLLSPEQVMKELNGLGFETD